MSKTKMIKKLGLGVLLSTISAGMIFSGFIGASAQRIGIKPFSEPNSEVRSWFVYNAQAGETIKDHVVITNSSDFNGKVFVTSNDATVGSSGGFTIASNEVENTQVGKWVSLEKNEYDVPAENAIKIPFEMTIPAGTPSGQYAGGISVITMEEGEDAGALGTKVRMGARIYVYVGDDLRVNNKINSLTAIEPNMEFFYEELNNRGFISPENMVVKFFGKNEGNVYSYIDGTLTVTMPNGETKTFSPRRELNVGSQYTDHYIETQLPYTVGKTTFRYEYESKPLIESDKVKVENGTGVLEYEMNLTAEDIQKITDVRKELADGAAKEFDKKPTQENQDFAIEEPVKEVKEFDYMPILIAGGAIITALLVVVIVLLLKKKEKKEEPKKEEESKK